jgi:hypothetical protein
LVSEEQIVKYIQFRTEYPETDFDDREALFPNAADLDRNPRVRQHLAQQRLKAFEQARANKIAEDYNKHLREVDEHKMWRLARKKILELLESDDERIVAQVALKVYGGRFTYHSKVAELQAEKYAGKENPDVAYPEPSGSTATLAKSSCWPSPFGKVMMAAGSKLNSSANA